LRLGTGRPRLTHDSPTTHPRLIHDRRFPVNDTQYSYSPYTHSCECGAALDVRITTSRNLDLASLDSYMIDASLSMIHDTITLLISTLVSDGLFSMSQLLIWTLRIKTPQVATWTRPASTHPRSTLPCQRYTILSHSLYLSL